MSTHLIALAVLMQMVCISLFASSGELQICGILSVQQQILTCKYQYSLSPYKILYENEICINMHIYYANFNLNEHDILIN